jgi:hypothetical protein
MSEVDRMAVIAREVLWCNTAECDGPAIEDPEDPGNCDECAQPLERVEVVRADIHRGAVEALQEAIEAARLFNRSGMTWSEYDALLARLEHDHLGGQ